MKKKISIEEIEEIIKNKLKQNGVLEVVAQEKIAEIKNKVKEILEKGKNLDEQAPENIEKKNENPAPVQTSNPNVTVQSSEDPEKTEFLKKETELDNKEKELIKKEIELEQKLEQIKNKEEELKYKPQLPEILKSFKPGEILIYDRNELSLGMENLSNRNFRLKQDPDEKKSIKDLWLLSAITNTEVYLVELKKIGELKFNPYEGTTTFENISDVKEFSEINDNEKNQHDVESAIKSQIPDEEMLDAIVPVTDVTQPILNTDELEKQKFEDNFKDIITKIVSDQLNKISSETTKKNIFSL